MNNFIKLKSSQGKMVLINPIQIRYVKDMKNHIEILFGADRDNVLSISIDMTLDEFESLLKK